MNFVILYFFYFEPKGLYSCITIYMYNKHEGALNDKI